MIKSAVTAEQWPYKVAAVFDNLSGARKAAESLYQSPKINSRRIDILEPGDPLLSQKLEPEKGGIKRTLVRSHITLGVIGALTGIVVALVLAFTGMQAAASSPWYAMMALGFVGGMVGLLIGGVFSIRPDHDLVINRAREAADRGEWMVVVHTRDRDQESVAKTALNQMTDDIVTTL